MIGHSVGNYQITRLLGEGGMGMVYLAEHPTLGRRAAVKVLHPDLAATDEMIQRLFNEARAANAIGHPGIIEVSDLGVLPSGSPYIVMEFLDGQSLGARLTAAGRLSLRAALDIADQAASAVGAAHAKGIVHRDLKPDNLFLTADPRWPGREQLKVLDFGIAKLAHRPVSAGDVRTRTGAILGTPRYMSPEQCRDSRDVDHRTDIYSLGVIIHEMLAGTPPFVSHSWGEMAHLHIGVEPPALRASVPELPASVERTVLTALKKDPDARFQSMAELQQALARCREEAALAPEAIAEASEPFVRIAGSEPPVSTLRFDAPVATRLVRRTTLAGAASEIQRPPRPASRARRLAPILVAAPFGIAIVVAGVWATLRGPAVPPTVAPGGAPAQPVQAAPVPSAASRSVGSAPLPLPRVSDVEPRAISVEIVTNPPGALIIRESDRAILGSTPLRATWPRGQGSQPLRLEREGFVSERVMAPRDRDLHVSLDLKKMPSPAGRPAPAPRRRGADKTSPGPARTAAPEPFKV